MKVLLITGLGNSFIAGADIAEMENFTSKEAYSFSELGNNVFQKIEDLNIPVIAVINGYALGGGCELALSCDIRIASEKANFGLPEIKLGVIPGFGGVQRMSNLVGVSKAKELSFTGKTINSEESKNIGLINHIFRSEILLEESLKIADELAEKSKIILQYCKEAFSEFKIEEFLNRKTKETELFSLCFTTKDQKEGMKAFLEKRRPHFIDE